MGISNSRALRATARESLRTNYGAALVLLLVQSFVIYAASSFGLTIFVTGVLEAGSAYAYLRAVRGGERMDVGDLFRPLKDGTLANALLAGLLVTLLELIGYFFFFFPGVIISYTYRLVPYLISERRELGVIECMRESRRLMRGYKWRLFCLDLSFIGWILLCFFTCGIGYFFLAPYMKAASAAFAAERLAADDSGVFSAAPAPPIE